MDFLKSLLLYMTLSVAATVQGAEPPVETPVPTATPVIVVETAVPETAAPGADLTAAPETPTPTPAIPTPEPQPTITPNRAYRNLAFGARGDDVRRLQQALSDLGYQVGNIDGAYGYQTRNAVMKFQEYNGLTKDGVAGRATQTRLLEDPAVVPNPERVTPSPVPTATPDANGVIPLLDDPRSIWVSKRMPTVVVNGEVLSAPVALWQRGSELIVSLSDLAAAVPTWTLTAEDGQACALTLDAYEAAAVMDPAAQPAEGKTYCERYALTVNGAPAATNQGDWMYEDGQWFATIGCLEKVFGAQVIWDEEETALLLTILPTELAAATD